MWRNWRNSACLHKLIFWDLNSYESLLCVQRQSRLTTTAINLTGCDDDDGLQAQQVSKVSAASYQVLPHQEETPHIKVQLWSSHMGIRHPNEDKKLNISCMQPGCRQPACQLDVGWYPLINFRITSQPPLCWKRLKAYGMRTTDVNTASTGSQFPSCGNFCVSTLYVDYIQAR